MKKKLLLPNVTLLAITSTEIDMTQLALRISLRNIEFGAVKFFSSSSPQKKYSNIEYNLIEEININEYNRIIIEDLHKYFKTSHCLIVQADSFVVRSDLWNDDFIKYDYIGAPWSEKVRVNPNLELNFKKNPVGNGGFSLRSRKLVEVTSKLNFKSMNFPLKSEDVIICHYLYEEMIKKGIRFAPPELAAQFSMENENHLYGQDVTTVFGFHGKQFREYFLKKYILKETIGEW
tara:strand:- start:1051 stop:1749 length:699 start_codon:yes stop_codon:yes gene_type:complete